MKFQEIAQIYYADVKWSYWEDIWEHMCITDVRSSRCVSLRWWGEMVWKFYTSHVCSYVVVHYVYITSYICEHLSYEH